MGTAGHSARAVVARRHAERTDVGIHRLAGGEHAERRTAHEIVGERPAVVAELDEPGVRRPLQRLDDVRGVPADHRDDVGERTVDAEDRREGDDVAVLRRELTERALDHVVEGTAPVGRTSSGDGATQQQGVAAGEPGERRRQSVALDAQPVRGEHRRGGLVVEALEGDHGGVSLELIERASRLVRTIAAGTAGDDDEQWCLVQGAHDEPRQQRRGGVGEVGVVEHDRHRLLRGAPAQHVGDGGEPGEAVGVDGADATVLIEDRGRIVAPEVAQDRRPRPQWRCAAVGPTPSPRHGEASPGEERRGVLAQGRLAHPGGAADQHQSAVAVGHIERRVGHRGELALPSDEVKATDGGVADHLLDPTRGPFAGSLHLLCRRAARRRHA